MAGKCDFCERAPSPGQILLRGRKAAICEECLVIARSLVEERHEKELAPSGQVSIASFSADTELARLIGDRKLKEFGFVPLAVGSSRVVLAVSSLDHFDQIRSLVGVALSARQGLEPEDIKLNLVWAERNAIFEKIEQATCP